MQTSRVIAKSPHRISLFGGGSDVAPFSTLHGGLVINFAINLYTTVTIKNIFDVKIEGYEGSGGLGGSASLGVATMGSIYRYLGVKIDKYLMASLAFKKEMELGWHGGCQDQYTSACGGFNLIKVKDQVEVIPLPKEQIEGFLPYLHLFDLDMKRKSYKVQEGLKRLTKKQTEALWDLKNIVKEARNYFTLGDYEKLGRLFDKNWQIKKKTNKVTNKKIDAIYNKGMELGALGGKVLGAGQGGHIIFAVEPIKRGGFIRNMDLKHIPFKVDYKGLEVLRKR